MIHSFKCSETERIFRGEQSKVLPRNIQNTARRKLDQLNRATRVEDLRTPPGNRLELLQGDRAGWWSIRINNQWRVCFLWDNGAHEVEIVDYH